MCRVAQLHVPEDPIAASQARAFVSATLVRWGLGEIAPDAELAVSELVTNAIVHARTPIIVTACVADGMAEIAVTDQDPRTPRVRAARTDLLSDLAALNPGSEDHPDPRHPGLHFGPSGSVAAGRGLIILDAISDSWGSTTRPDGKDVWARLPVPASWPHLGSCVCAAQAQHSTASGLPLQHIAGAWDVA